VKRNMVYRQNQHVLVLVGEIYSEPVQLTPFTFLAYLSWGPSTFILYRYRDLDKTLQHAVVMFGIRHWQEWQRRSELRRWRRKQARLPPLTAEQQKREDSRAAGLQETYDDERGPARQKRALAISDVSGGRRVATNQCGHERSTRNFAGRAQSDRSNATTLCNTEIHMIVPDVLNDAWSYTTDSRRSIDASTTNERSVKKWLEQIMELSYDHREARTG
jgi:hypothetical protein